MKINVTYIVSRIYHSLAFEWTIKNLNRERFNLSFVLLDCKASIFEQFLIANGVPYHNISFKTKKDYPKAILQTRQILKEFKSTVIHCHMRDANIIGLSAAKSVGIKKRIYTRHYSTFNHDYHPRSVKVDKIMNSLATDVVAISEVVKKTLIKMEKLPESKVSTINHGFDLESFSKPNIRKVTEIQKKYNITNQRPVIGVIARYISWKGYQYMIPAFEEILNEFPHALFIFANALGPYNTNVKKLIQKHIPRNSLEITFEKDMFSLYQLFDIYVHTPINSEIEAFGQTYVEALAAGIPSVFTLSGISHEFIKDKHNALIVDYQNSAQISKAVKLLLNDDQLRDNLIRNGQASLSNFTLKKFICKLENLYD